MATAVSDTLISLLDTVGFSVPRVALVLWHDQWYVWFVPKVSPSKNWVANILVEVLVSHDLADIGKKNELELARVHWHAKEMATIQTKTNLWVMTKILVEVLVAHDLADIGKKNELELARVHWHAKNGNHPNKDQYLGHDQNFGKVHFGHNPNTPQHPARRGCTGHRDASAEWCSAANRILWT